MDPSKQREIASKGGKAAHQKGTAHEFTSEEARIAGRKGGAASRERRGKSESSSGEQQGSEQQHHSGPSESSGQGEGAENKGTGE